MSNIDRKAKSGGPPDTPIHLINVSRVDVRRLMEEIVRAWDDKVSARASAVRLERAIDNARAVLGIPKPAPQGMPGKK